MTRESTSLRRVCVVGNGVGGLAVALELATRSVAVDVISRSPAGQAGSVLFRDGIAAALPEGDASDSAALHASEIAVAANTSAALPVLRSMAEAAPVIVALLERMGVPFDRTPEGLLARYPTPGSSVARCVSAGSVTGHHVLLALDEQLRRLEREPVRDARGSVIAGEPLVRRLIPFELVGLVRDDAGVAVGVVVQDLRSMTMTALPYDAVVLATGGYEALFASSAGSPASLGSGVAIAFAEGAVLADADAVFCHPLAIAGPSKLYALPDTLRSQRARIFSSKASATELSTLSERERSYVPALADLNAPPRADVASRAISEALAKHGSVYLDLAHKKSDATLCARFLEISSLTERCAAKGLFDGPLSIRPAVTRTLGGLFVDHETRADGTLLASSPRSQATSIPGLYAVGGAASAPFNAAISASELLLCDMHSGRLAADGVLAYRAAMAKSAFDLPKSLFDGAQKRCDQAYAALLDQGSDSTDREDAEVIHGELCALMEKLAPLSDAAVIADAKTAIDTLEERSSRARCVDNASYRNQAAPFLQKLQRGLRLAKVALTSGGVRVESADSSRRVLARLVDGEPTVVHSVEYAAAGKTVKVDDTVRTAETAQHG